MKYELCIVGGAGHIGLPLGIVFANSGTRTVLFDINQEALAKVRAGKLPFVEHGGDEVLKSALEKNCLFTSDTPEAITDSKYVVIVVGTPVDEYLSPQFGAINRLVDRYMDYFRDGQIVILRSTVYPGTTERIQNHFLAKNKKVKLAFCPERIMQGHAIEESRTLTQIISAFDDETLHEVSALFKRIALTEPVHARPIEAELAKLFTNAWRYIRFAVANQFFMIAQDHQLNYHRIYKIMKHNYQRNADLPSPGFAAGPCLLKDTMQLAAFANNNFYIGHAAMLINEGLVNHLVSSLRREFRDSLKEKTISILGMSFKAEVDDPRDSLSYKLRKFAQMECKRVLCTDEYIQDPTFVPLETALQESDIVVLATAHEKYLGIDHKKYPNKKFVDIWNAWGFV